MSGSEEIVYLIEYESRHKFFFNLKGDSLTMESFYGPFPAAVTVNGKPWSDPSKPFRIPFKPNYSNGFAMAVRNVTRWRSQAACDGKDRAELLIATDYEDYMPTKNTVILLFDPNPALVAQMKAAEDAKKAAENVAVGPAPTKSVNSVAFDPKTMSEKPAA